VIGKLQKSARAEKGTLVAFGAEGLSGPTDARYVVNTIIVNDQVRWLSRALQPSAFVRAWGRRRE